MKIELIWARRNFISMFVPGFALLATASLFIAPEALAQSSPRRPAGRAAPVPFTLVDSGQELGSFSSWGVSLADADNDGDLDGDGDRDILSANVSLDRVQPNKVWVNTADRNSSVESSALVSGQF